MSANNPSTSNRHGKIKIKFCLKRMENYVQTDGQRLVVVVDYGSQEEISV